MVNTCVAVGCESGYLSQSKSSKDKVHSFRFPMKKPHLLFYWERNDKENGNDDGYMPEMPGNPLVPSCRSKNIWKN